LDQKIFGQVFPRITGLSRMLAVIDLAILASFLFIKKDQKLKVVEFILITIISMLIWSCQSRGSILCFSLSALILIFFSKEYNIKKKVIVIFFFIIFPIIIFESYKNYKIDLFTKELTANNLDSKILSEKLNSLNYKNLNRIEKSTQFGSSGRLNLWKDVIEKYDIKKIFGYGPQADRFLISSEINQEYGNNVSNGFVYAFACAGYFGIIVFFIINLKMLIFLYKTIFIQKIFSVKKYFGEKLATTYLIFFGIRNLFENSYALFSVDFLMTLICFVVIADYLDKKNYLKSNSLK
jgi:O-antigen ligase